VTVSLIIYAVDDMTIAKKFFSTLNGSDPYVDSPQYTGYKVGDVEIGLIPKYLGAPSVLAYWDVDDINATISSLVDAGGSVAQEPRDVGYGLLVASVNNGNGATIGLRQKPKG
jgi:predicted enzyme related to lactoylglutathione lyase